MRKLLEGILDFHAKREAGNDLLFKHLTARQQPDALFITCSDSRVVPNLLVSTNPGDLFVMRNVGNVVPACCDHSGYSKTDDSEIAALEYALNCLQVKDIIVCGHSNCGAIHAIYKNSTVKSAPHLNSWLSHAKDALDTFEHPLTFDKDWSVPDRISQKNVLLQIEHLKTYDIVQSALQKKQTALHAWWFDIEEVEIYSFNRDENKFKVINPAEAQYILQTSI
ncbi:carbonic anhydrase [bacterium]|nr:carbonic anhydrase [bacterium]